MLAGGVFSLLALTLISRESLDFLKSLPLPWLAFAGLLTGFSFITSVFKDFSVKESLTLMSVIGASVLTAYLARKGRSRWLLAGLLISGVIAVTFAVPSYLTAASGSQGALAISGSFHYPNGLGSFLLLISFLPFTFLFHSRSLFVSVPSGLALATLWAALILTHSRGVWAAGTVALVFWALADRKRVWANRSRLAMATVLMVGLVLIASRRAAEIAPHFVSLAAAPSRTSDDASFQWRRDIYAWTLDIIKDHPWTGTGIGTFPIAIKRYQRAPYITGRYAHNHYLQTAAEMGLPALAGLLLFLGFLFRRSWIIVRSLEPDSRERSLAVGLATGLLASSLHALVDLGWSYPAVALVFGVEAAMLFGLAPRSFDWPGRGFSRPAMLQMVRPVLLVLCLVMAAIAGSRYYAELFRNEGNRAMEAGDWKAAIAALRWSARLDPFFYSPRQRLALAYAAEGDLTNSQQEAEAAFRLNRYDGDAYHALARIYWRAGEHTKAESEFRSALSLQPYARLSFYYDLAELFLAMGRPAEAREQLKRGVEIFRPEIVTSRVNRCLAPGDRYILARMYWRMAEIWQGEHKESEADHARGIAMELAKPAIEEICFRGMTGRLLSPEATIVAHWDSRRRRDWPGVIATFARDASGRLKDESLTGLPSDIERVEVDWIASLVGNEDAAAVSYELKIVSEGGQIRKAAFTDALVVEREGWRLRHRSPGSN